jgi:pimeloyl-ACP methyl ester carboxylesterase
MAYAGNGRVRIYWETEGAGDPLLLIMGLSFPLAMWGDLRPFLARRFRVILLDNRGVGKSDVPLLPFSIGSMAEDALAVLDAAGAQVVHVFGISMGGMIAQELAARYPRRVGKLILGCTHGPGHQSVLAEPRVLAPLSFPFMTREARIRAVTPLIYDPHTPRERIERDLDLFRSNPTTTRGYLQQLASIARWRVHGKPRRIEAPTLILHGETDRLVPPENAKLLAGRIPDSKVVMLPGAGHIFPTDQPERTRLELMTFLNGGAHAGPG